MFGLQKVLETIRRLAEVDETAAAARFPTLNELLLRFNGELESLNATLNRNTDWETGRNGRMQALIWPLRESEVNKALDKLGTLQDLLDKAMGVDQTYVTFSAFDKILIFLADT
jgi:hypothetical protein